LLKLNSLQRSVGANIPTWDDLQLAETSYIEEYQQMRSWGLLANSLALPLQVIACSGPNFLPSVALANNNNNNNHFEIDNRKFALLRAWPK
jgi:hypothetical protein